MEGLLARLMRGDVLVGDGAWGTQLMQRGLPAGQPPEWFALERPEAIEEVARLYVDAGADLVTTDTFEPKLKAGGAVDQRTTRKKLSPLRRKIATQLVAAQHTAAILTTFNECDMSGAMKLRAATTNRAACAGWRSRHWPTTRRWSRRCGGWRSAGCSIRAPVVSRVKCNTVGVIGHDHAP